MFLFTITFSIASAQNISLSGTVRNQQGAPVAGAEVTLLGKDLSTTTGNDGKFEIVDNNVPVRPVFTVPIEENVALHGGLLELCIPTAEKVKIELFDVKGILLERTLDRNLAAGTYRYTPVSSRFAAQMMFIRVSIGGRITTLRYLPVRNGRYAAFPSAPGMSSGGTPLSKVQADIDSLEVSADGYETKVVAVSSYEDEFEITLTPETVIDLEPFSFFVTSLEAIQKLSGSQDGFGGDLRFGKTGQGAGLLGADSICECIAEMSMPGSKVKQWRAFLSVKVGPDGNQVNARDRIGNGPWYDRLGRLLSPTLDDLLNERPEGGDSEIRDDLPNENGIPNHRPDPAGGDVDNHHFITGSDAEGRLYGENTTCEDWTTAEKSTGARAGLSWPRFGGGGFPKTQWGGGGMESTHWISAVNEPGCKPGTDLSGASMGGSPNNDFIGSGGGYGGFYCFALKP
jgi:hypothetical protein